MYVDRSHQFDSNGKKHGHVIPVILGASGGLDFVSFSSRWPRYHVFQIRWWRCSLWASQTTYRSEPDRVRYVVRVTIMLTITVTLRFCGLSVPVCNLGCIYKGVWSAVFWIFISRPCWPRVKRTRPWKLQWFANIALFRSLFQFAWAMNPTFDTDRPIKHVSRKAIYTRLEARIDYLRSFLDFNTGVLFFFSFLL